MTEQHTRYEPFLEASSPVGQIRPSSSRRKWLATAGVAALVGVVAVTAIIVLVSRRGGSPGDRPPSLISGCTGDRTCGEGQVCSNYYPSIQGDVGFCEPIPHNHCLKQGDCPQGTLCLLSTEDEHGGCVSHDTLFTPVAESLTRSLDGTDLSTVTVPFKQEEALPRAKSKSSTNMHVLADYSTPTCGEGTCDNPSSRALYSSAKVTVDITVYLLNPAQELKDRVDQSITLTQQRFAAAGITINVKRSALSNTALEGLLISKATSDAARQEEGCVLSGQSKNCIGAIDYANTLVPNWYNAQTFSVFVAPLIVDRLRGWAYFPWQGSTHGAVFVNSLTTATAVGGDASTMPHELGHGLGLWHTFRGEAEVSSCGSCSEYVGMSHAQADVRGDFCADTPPQPRTWDCSDPSEKDPCTGSAFTNTPHHNLMSYAPASCRTELTAEQAARAKCWIYNADKYFVSCRTAADANGFKMPCSSS